MIPLSPALFMAGARTLIAANLEIPQPSTSKRKRLAEVDPIERDVHGAEDGVTTAAFIAHVGYWAHRNPEGMSSWPFPLDADCDALARIGIDCGVVSPATPKNGAIYLRRSIPEARFVSAGIVLEVADRAPLHGVGWTHDLHLLEGSAALSAVGTTVQWARQVRLRCSTDLGDRFLSWVDLDGRNATTSVRFHRRAAA